MNLPDFCHFFRLYRRAGNTLKNCFKQALKRSQIK